MSDSVVVVGAGIIGATTAWRLAERGWSVELWSDVDWRATTSAVAAAIWRPYRAQPEHDVLRWSARTLEVYADLALLPGSGVTMVPGLELGRGPMADPGWASALPSFTHATPEQLPPGYADALAYIAPVIAMNIHLPWLIERLELMGVRRRRERVASLSELSLAYTQVVNATGLGSRSLVPDPGVHPVRGQVLRLTNPGLQGFRLDYDHPRGLTYVVPRGDDVIVGGTDQENSWDTEVDENEATGILARCRELCPELEDAVVLDRAVGLRPARASVRVEVEHTRTGRIIHNYGHGGAGVTTAWGCADDVAALIGDPRTR
ncbi:MAG: hypothetical protein JWR85_3172 [Marmoricola sp.]|nr:hypothetical protein [Marmoricola sp.]